MSQMLTARPRLRRVTAASVAVGAVGSVALAASMGATLSGFTASITNSSNTAASAALAVEETSGAATCRTYDTTSTCSTINKYGGTATPMVPGGTAQTVSVTFTNTGSVAVGSADLAPGACVATSTGVTGAVTPATPNTSPTNLCSVLTVKIYKAATATGPTIYSGTLANLTSPITLDPLAKGASQGYTFVVELPTGATTAVQGQQVSQPLVWNFSQ